MSFFGKKTDTTDKKYQELEKKYKTLLEYIFKTVRDLHEEYKKSVHSGETEKERRERAIKPWQEMAGVLRALKRIGFEKEVSQFMSKEGITKKILD